MNTPIRQGLGPSRGSISSTEVEEAITRIVETETTAFTQLVEIAGLDPSTDFRFANLTGVDFSGSDLSGFDFTGALLEGAKFDGAQISDAVFDDAKGDLTPLRRA